MNAADLRASKTEPLSSGASNPAGAAVHAPEYYLSVLRRVEDALSLGYCPDAFLTGSIGEGFSNSTSDIDVYLVAENAVDSGWRRHFFFGDVRVEAFIVSYGQLEHLAEMVNRLSIVDLLSSDMEWMFDPKFSLRILHEYQQVSRALILRGGTRLASVREGFSQEHAARLLNSLYLKLWRARISLADILEGYGFTVGAFSLARRALLSAANGWAASAGESYCGEKFIEMKLERAEFRALDEFCRLLRLGTSAGMPDVVRAFVANEFGMEDGRSDAHLRVNPKYAWHDLGTGPFGVSSDGELAVLSPDAQEVRSLVELGRIDCYSEYSEALGIAIRDLVLSGIIQVQIPTMEAWPASVIEPVGALSAHVVVTMDGPQMRPTAPRQCAVLKGCVSTLASAGLDLVKANFDLDNLREDYVGALSAGQLSIAEYSLQQQIRRIVAIWIASERWYHRASDLDVETYRLTSVEVNTADDLSNLVQRIISTPVASADDANSLEYMVASAMALLDPGVVNSLRLGSHSGLKNQTSFVERGKMWQQFATVCGIGSNFGEGMICPY